MIIEGSTNTGKKNNISMCISLTDGNSEIGYAIVIKIYNDLLRG